MRGNVALGSRADGPGAGGVVLFQQVADGVAVGNCMVGQSITSQDRADCEELTKVGFERGVHVLAQALGRDALDGLDYVFAPD